MQSPLPIAAHNCLPRQPGDARNRLDLALSLGFDNIEIDVAWDSHAQQLVISDEGALSVAGNRFELGDYLLPSLQKHLATPRPDGAPRFLTIDFKSNEAAAVAYFSNFLIQNKAYFSSARKASVSQLITRQLTVCITGDSSVALQYDALVENGGEYLAFSDREFGPLVYHEDPTTYAKDPATPYCRFLSLFWGQVEHKPAFLAYWWSSEDEQRLRRIVDCSHKNGYWIRFYTLNQSGQNPLYRFPSARIAHHRWSVAANAKADWIATDDYEEIVRVLSK